MGQFIETYRGEALAWEADELGHMNMRFYFARAAQARANFLIDLGLADVFKNSSFSTLVPTRQHIKYHKEVRPGEGMAAKTAIVHLSKTEIVLVHIITKTPQIVSATIVETLQHISRRTGEAFAWPKRLRERAFLFKVEVPEEAIARNINIDEPLGSPSLVAADKFDLPVIGRGMFAPTECGAQGFVTKSAVIGRVSDSVQHLKTAWPDLDFASDDGMSGALLEAQAMHRNRPKAGDCYVIRSGLRSASTHVRELCHWILDPVSGKCWSTFIGVGCRFNLKTRRLVKIDASILELLEKGIVHGLKP